MKKPFEKKMLIQNLNYSQSHPSSLAFQSSRLAWLVGESILFVNPNPANVENMVSY
jgi:hypothetical protein